MANIFKEQKAVNEHPNRNNFDLSKKSNLSMKFGTLYPVYCQPVVPGDSFSIDTAFNLKLQPVVFPVQTKMRAHMHYFYVRNKNIWTGWENWISNLKSQSETPHPYISCPDIKFKSGSIHDYLGVPTSLISKSEVSLPFYQDPDLTDVEYTPTYLNYYYTLDEFKEFASSGTEIVSSSFTTFDYVLTLLDVSDDPMAAFDCRRKLLEHNIIKNLSGLSNDSGSATYQFGTLTSNLPIVVFTYPFNRKNYVAAAAACYEDEDGNICFDLSLDELERINNARGLVSFRLGLQFSTFEQPVLTSPVSIDNQISLSYVRVLEGWRDYSEIGIDLYSNNLHINALPYRAYESIYYCYYNNNVLNPLKINNQVQYNRYNTNLGDGADTTDYHLFQRNYELDFLTSALPSPQQGVAPVVGMTALGDITIEDENGITTARAIIDDDGTISKVVLTSPAASNEHARTAMNIASCGMSISDFRQTNALQRFLETNIRKGYRYMDFIAGHFGKEPEYRELDLPEFIGGFSRDVEVSTVVSNADTILNDSDYGASLGQYGGYAQVVGGSRHSVRHYCDDYGYIIGILSVVPTPCYSQLLPKHMIAPDNFLDYYFPEFSSSGLQPITYKEVCPIQSYLDSLNDSDKRLEDTFGYQRPNYDLVSAVDELHGDFRGSLKDYVINRQFNSRPELGQSFICINPAEINDIFVDTNPDDDTIIGEIGFAVHAKRPVPRVVIPNLGK